MKVNMFDFASLLGRRNSRFPAVRRDTLISLLALAWVVEARDPYTGGHLWRVSRYANLVAKCAGLAEHRIAQITLGGFLHDLGKVGIPDAILLKTDKLSDNEYATIKTHPEVGKNLLCRHPLADLVMDAVYSHHERPDGKGYPRGLKSRQIPEMAAIVGICDAFDAMTSVRPYRQPLPAERALGIIEQNLGTQFDRRYGQIFLDLGRTTEVQHVIGHSDDGIPLRHCVSCGPTIVVKKNAMAGSKVYCPTCSSGYVLQGAELLHVPTGEYGTAKDLEPTPDQDLIERVANTQSVLLDAVD